MINVKEIVILEEAVMDLLKGKTFYSQKEKRLGDYFRDSLVSDIESLYLFASIHIQINSA